MITLKVKVRLRCTNDQRLLANLLLLQTPFPRQRGGPVYDLSHVVDAHSVTVGATGAFIDRVLIYCDLQIIFQLNNQLIRLIFC